MTEHLDDRSARRVVQALGAHGVTHVFGIPGAKVDAVFDALVDEGPELVVCRHEQNAAFMAAAVGRLTGSPGVVLVTSGPGTTNLATGLLTANTEQDPVVALAGAVPLADRLKRTHQSMDAAAFLSHVAKHVVESTHPDDVSEAVTNAFRAAVTEPRGAAAVVLTASVLAAPTDRVLLGPATTPTPGPARAADLDAVAELLRAAQRPVLLAGLRATSPSAVAALRDLIRATGLPVVETFQAAGLVSRELERHYLGRVGLFRNQPGDLVLAESDLVLAVGYDAVEYDPALWNSEPGRRIVHLDSVAVALDARYQPTLELLGDIGASVAALVPLVAEVRLSEEAAARVDAHRAELTRIDDEARRARSAPGTVDPARLVLRMRDLLDDTATVACDIGSAYIHVARHFRIYQPRHLLFSNGQQTLGVAFPWAMAARLVRPDAQVVSISGDGGFLFSAQEIETAVRLGLKLTHVIFRDDTYDMVAFQQWLKYGRASGVQLGDYDIEKFAAAFGARGRRVGDLAGFEEAFRASLDEDGVSIVDVRVDYRRNADLAADLPPDAFE